MLLKTYRGPDLATALRQVRRELGPEALVLGTSEQRSRFGLSVVEVTVAAPRQETEVTLPGGDPTLRQLADEVRDLRAVLERSRRNQAGDVTLAGHATPVKKSTPALDVAVQRLIAVGLAPELAARFGRVGDDTGGDARGLATGLTNELKRILEFAPLPTRGRCLFVVGPPGSGKTTTVAKLASRVCLADRPAVFAVADNERIGGFEQAEVYSRHIGARVARLAGPQDLRRELERNGDGVVLVDTCGIGTGDRSRTEQLLELRREASDAEVAVLIPAGLHHAEALRVIDRFAPLQPTCVGFSRVDDSARLGELVTAVSRRNLPLSFIADGHAVPDALESATPQGLASLLLRSGETGRATENLR